MSPMYVAAHTVRISVVYLGELGILVASENRHGVIIFFSFVLVCVLFFHRQSSSDRIMSLMFLRYLYLRYSNHCL